MRRRKLAMKQPSAPRLGPVALKILGYLRTHPRTEDTLQGIAEWWLLQQRIRHQKAQVLDALSELVAQAHVIERQGPRGRAFYRIKTRKVDP